MKNFRKNNNPSKQSKAAEIHASDTNQFVEARPVRPAQSQVGQLTSVLADVLPGVVDEVGNSAQVTAQEDVTRQANRADAGLGLAEDATVAGQDAYTAINTRNAILTEMDTLQDTASQFEGSPVAWADFVEEEQTRILGQYPDASDAVVAQMADVFRSRLPIVNNSFVQANDARNQKLGYDTLTGSLLHAVNVEDPKERSDAISSAIEEVELDVLGLHGATIEKALLDSGINAAKYGDTSILDYMDELGMTSQYPVLRDARSTADSYNASQNADLHAVQKMAVMERLDRGIYPSFSEFAKDYTEASKTEDGTVTTTDDQLMGKWMAGNANRNRKTHAKEGLTQAFNVMIHPGGSIPVKTQKEQDDIFAEYNEQMNAQLNAYSNSEDYSDEGYDELRHDLITKKADITVKTGWVDTELKNTFQRVASFSAASIPDDDTGVLPRDIAEALATWESLSSHPSLKFTHANADTRSILNGFEANLRVNSNPVQAFKAAQDAFYNPNITFQGNAAERTKGISEALDGLIHKKYSHRWTGIFTGSSSMPDSNIAHIKGVLGKEVKALLDSSQHMSIEEASSLAFNGLADTSYQTPSGVLVNATEQQLLASGTPRDALGNATSTIPMKLDPRNLTDFFNIMPQGLASLNGSTGYEGLVLDTNTPTTEWIPKIIGGQFYYVNSSNQKMTKPIDYFEAVNMYSKYSVIHAEAIKARLDAEKKRAQDAKPFSRTFTGRGSFFN